MPSLRRGVTTTPTSPCPKERPRPTPVPRPLQGGGSIAPPRRSVIKVLLPKVGRREIPYATKLRLFMFAPLTSMRKTIQFWFLLRLLVRASPASHLVI